eukprot:122288_1
MEKQVDYWITFCTCRNRECGMCGKYLSIELDCSFCQHCGFNINQEEFSDVLYLKGSNSSPKDKPEIVPVYQWKQFLYFWFVFKYRVSFCSTEGVKYFEIQPFVARIEATKKIQQRLLDIYNLMLYRLIVKSRYIANISLPRKFFGDSADNVVSNQFVAEIQHYYLQPLLFSYYAMDIFKLNTKDIQKPVVFAVNPEQVELVKHIYDLKKGMTVTFESQWTINQYLWLKTRKCSDIIVVIGFIRQIQNQDDINIPSCIQHLCVLFFTKYPNQKLCQILVPNH